MLKLTDKQTYTAAATFLMENDATYHQKDAEGGVEVDGTVVAWYKRKSADKTHFWVDRVFLRTKYGAAWVMCQLMRVD